MSCLIALMNTPILTTGALDYFHMAYQLLSTVAHQYTTLPASYIRPASQRPCHKRVITDAAIIPTIDLSLPPSVTVPQLADACTFYGFFQVVNHGVAMESMQQTLAVGKEFFRLPPQEMAQHYSDDPTKTMRLSTSFNVRKETVRNWRDYLRLHCYPLEDHVPSWPSNPTSFKEIISSYCREVRELGCQLVRGISQSLELQEDFLLQALGEQEQHMAINYYPKCPEPELTLGLQAHTDPNALTILLQDPNVAGLQVLKDGQWIDVNPQPNALVVNIGDQLQALSNGRYKSVQHRAVVNAEQERLSVASFLCPSSTAVISPLEKLVGQGSPAMYRSYTYAEYYAKFWSGSLDDRLFEFKA